jgi:hypothetical protein
MDMTKDPFSAASAGNSWVERVGQALENLGFCLIEAYPSADDTGRLLVALRPVPTLSHFDPEQIDYWVSEAGRGKATSMDLTASFPVDGRFAWGRITLCDRLGVTNQFLSFGGDVHAERIPDSTVLVEFSSLSPILRWSGHSQALDPLTAEAGAFFARMKVPIDFVAGAEALVAAAAPRTLYCAFIQHVRERLSKAPSMRDANRWLAGHSAREYQRLEAASPEDWKAALELRRKLGLTGAAAR